MPRRSGRSRDDALLDAVEAADQIMAWSEGKTLTDYESDRLLRSGIERLFQIFSEALQIADGQDETLRTSIPRLGDIIGMRNAIVHGYFNVDNGLVWSAVTQFLPPIREHILQVLAGESRGSADTWRHLVSGQPQPLR